jgi:hypothetical protein
MARTIAEIQADIIAAKNNNSTLAALDSSSSTAIWRLWTYITAVAIWALEKLFDQHMADVQDTLSRLKPHSLRWYAEKAKAFRYGQALLPESDNYSNEGLTEQQIRASQIVKYAAVVEQEQGLRIKVATMGAADLQPLSAAQMAAFAEYMQRVKDAGVRLLITTAVADGLKLGLTIYYNPLVLNAQGERIDGGGNTPVKDAIEAYLRSLPFNGVFVLAYLTDVLQQVEGVVVPHITYAAARYGSLPYTGFSVEYQPDSGYLRFEQPADLTISYVPKSPL